MSSCSNIKDSMLVSRLNRVPYYSYFTKYRFWSHTTSLRLFAILWTQKGKKWTRKRQKRGTPSWSRPAFGRWPALSGGFSCFRVKNHWKTCEINKKGWKRKNSIFTIFRVWAAPKSCSKNTRPPSRIVCPFKFVWRWFSFANFPFFHFENLFRFH